MIINEQLDNSDDFYENESKRIHKMHNEKLMTNNNPYAGKKRNFKKQQYDDRKGDDNGASGSHKPYGNTYGRKGQTNIHNLSTNDELKASMWMTHGFIVDKNLNKLARML